MGDFAGVLLALVARAAFDVMIVARVHAAQKCFVGLSFGFSFVLSFCMLPEKSVSFSLGKLWFQFVSTWVRVPGCRWDREWLGWVVPVTVCLSVCRGVQSSWPLEHFRKNAGLIPARAAISLEPYFLNEVKNPSQRFCSG